MSLNFSLIPPLTEELAALKCLKNQRIWSCGSRAPVCDDTFLSFVRHLRWCVQYRKTALRIYRVARLPEHAIYAISGERNAAVRLLQGTQVIRTTDVRVRHPRICQK